MAVTSEHAAEGDENVERGNWSSKTDYLLSVIGSAVGLGNIWRFPYLAYRNRGGTFLIPYAVMLALAGMPMFFLETSFGQFASLGPVAVWKAVPILQDPLCNLTLGDGYFEIVNTTWLQANNETCPNGSEISVPHQGPSEQYWDKVVLLRTPSMDETGDTVWHLPLCLLLAWLMVGAVLFRGIKSSGKVVYFTATFPYVVLAILLIRGVTLEGASKGIEFYIGSQSDFSKLAEAQVWKDAAIQIFFTFSVGSGTLITLSSYNKFHNNCYRDTIIVCVVNCATSVFAGFVVFSILGLMALVQDKPVSELVQSEKIITTLLDRFPTYLRSKRFCLTTGICMLFYLLGLVSVTQAGIYWINLIDHFCVGWVPIIITLLELMSVSWLYGINRFIKDIEMMIGKRTWLFWLWWRMCWSFVIPCLMTVLLFWSLTTFAPPTYGPVEYPVWAIALGWCMIIFCIMWVPIVAVVRVVQAEGSTLWQKISAACTSAPDWGPYLEQHRGERYRKRPDSTEGPNGVQLLATPEM